MTIRFHLAPNCLVKQQHDEHCRYELPQDEIERIVKDSRLTELNMQVIIAMYTLRTTQ
jgi:hypothetical protein